MKDRVAERLINHIWDEQHLISSSLKTSDGIPVEIIYQGRWNPKEGPDFKGAKVRIGDKVLKGDVEIHIRASDWCRHGHDKDPRYDGVIIHVVLVDDMGFRATNSKGDPVPTIPIAPFLDSSLDKLWIGFEALEGGPSLQGRPCYEAYERLGSERIMGILEEAGWRRFGSKTNIYLEAESDIEGAIYGMFMDALGYSRNREPFAMLAKAVPYSSLARMVRIFEDEPVLSIQAALLVCSGLVPEERDLKLDEETRIYISRIMGRWEQVKGIIGEVKSVPKSSWICSGTRPENHPARRIGTASYFLASSLKGGGIKALMRKAVGGKAGGDPDFIRSSLVGLLSFDLPEDEYWAYRYSFGGKRIEGRLRSMGSERANDITINVFLPALRAIAMVEKDPELLRAVEQAFLNYPALQENEITRYMTREILGGGKIPRTKVRAIHQQGFIGIYKDFCEDRICDVCPIGEHLA